MSRGREIKNFLSYSRSASISLFRFNSQALLNAISFLRSIESWRNSTKSWKWEYATDDDAAALRWCNPCQQAKQKCSNWDIFFLIFNVRHVESGRANVIHSILGVFNARPNAHSPLNRFCSDRLSVQKRKCHLYHSDLAYAKCRLKFVSSGHLRTIHFKRWYLVFWCHSFTMFFWR